MSTSDQPYPYPQQTYDQLSPAKKKRRVFLCGFFLAAQVLFVVWTIAGAASGNGTPTDCGGLSAKTCNDAADVGTGIGVVLIVILWMVVDVLMAMIYRVDRLAERT